MDRLLLGKNGHRLHRPLGLLGFTYLLIVLQSTHSFNIDTTNVKITKGSDGSHFGYSFGFDKKRNRLLVGAPKHALNVKGLSIHPGVVNLCSQPYATKMDCSGIDYDTPQFYKDPNSLRQEGYGTSVSASDTGYYAMCAPYWKDIAYQSTHYMFVPGRCVVVGPNDDEQDVEPYFHNAKTAEQYLPTKDYFHGFASFGLSTDTVDGSTFVFGAPGLTIFEGGIYIKDFQTHKFAETIRKEFKNVYKKFTNTAYGYLGYEVKIGKFCDGDICIAAGAPNLYTFGMVKLYRWINKDLLYNFQNLDGEKTWSYFGSVLCAVDTDRDKIDELLVGAPYYGDSNSNSFDTGKVYVYKRIKNERDFEKHITLQGNGRKYARFGSAIQSIGDINLDHYEDVAIGAPGEENDSGCIYIYLGSQIGLVSKYSQRICANEVPGTNNLRWFGSKISSSFKQSSSYYPMFATSSFINDTVIVFNTRVIVRPHAAIQSSPNPIDLAQRCIIDSKLGPCTTFDVCYTQRMMGVATRKLDFIVRIEVDQQRRQGVHQRIQFNHASGQLVDSLGDINVYGVDQNGFCQKFTAVTNKDEISKDRFTPIEFKVTMEIDQARAGRLDPILEPTTANTFTHMVSLANDCGSDNICDVDLRVAGTIGFSHEEDWQYIIVGHTKEIEVDLTISNDNEPSYGTKVTVRLSQNLPYLRFTSDTIKHCQQESSVLGPSVTEVVCNYYLPLKKDDSIKLSLMFDVMNVALNKKTVTVTAILTPTDTIYSTEKNFNNNDKEMTTSVYIVADVNMLGSSSPAEVTIKTAKKLSLSVQEPITTDFAQDNDTVDVVVLNHKYQMKNLGPSFLPKTAMYLTIPAYLADASQLISRVSVQLKSGDQAAVSCTNIVNEIEGGIDVDVSTIAPMVTTSIDHSGLKTTSDDGPKTTTVWSPNGGIHKRRKREAVTGGPKNDENSQDFSETYMLTCETSPKYCIIFKCELDSDIPSGSHVSLNVTLEVDKENIPIPEGFTSFYLQLKGLVQQPNHILFKPWSSDGWKQASARTGTIFHIVESGGEINIWIIIGSVIAGLLLIFVIALIFWKLGFFKRKKHVEMEEWRRKSMRASKAPASDI